MKRAILLVSLPALLAASAGVAFLKIPVDARVCGVGEAGTGWLGNSAALHYNPAGLARVTGLDLRLMHNDWLLDMTHDYVAGAWGAENLGTFGLALDYWNSGLLQGIDYRGETLPGYTFSATDWSLGLGYARQFGPVCAGLALKHVSEHQETLAARAWAADAGVMLPGIIEGLDVGAGVANLGTKARLATEDCDLPLTGRVGWRYSRWGFGLSQDFILSEVEMPGIAAGLEYSILDLVALRVGWRTGSDPGGLAHLRAGLGVNWRWLSVDYAFAPYGALGMVHRVQLGVRWLPAEETGLE